MRVLYISYALWKNIAQSRGFAVYHKVIDTEARSVWAGDLDIIYHADVETDNYADWAATFTSSTEVSNEDEAIAYITGLGAALTPRTTEGVQRVAVEKTEGERVTRVTSNWCDPCSWYYNSIKNLGKELDQTTEGLGYVFKDPDGKKWVDNYHGRYSNEDTLQTKDGDIPRLRVYVDGVEKIEQDPHLGTGGDYTVEYDAEGGAEVTFFASQDGKTVTVDTWEVSGSRWVLKPSPGKKLKLVSVEAQFSTDLVIRDSVKFQFWVGGYPYGPPSVYKTQMDFINESNGSMPIIPKTNGIPSWRDLPQDIVVYPWSYQALISLPSSLGAEIEIFLEHDEPFGGYTATATFYCLEYDE